GHLRNPWEFLLTTAALCVSASPYPPDLRLSAESTGDSPCDSAPLCLCENPSLICGHLRNLREIHLVPPHLCETLPLICAHLRNLWEIHLATLRLCVSVRTLPP